MVRRVNVGRVDLIVWNVRDSVLLQLIGLSLVEITQVHVVTALDILLVTVRVYLGTFNISNVQLVMMVRLLGHFNLILQLGLEHLSEHVLGVTIARHRHLSALQLTLEDVLTVVHWLVIGRLVLVLLKARIINTVVHCTSVVVGCSAGVSLAQIILRLLKVDVDLTIVLNGWLSLQSLLHLITSHFVLFNSIYN